MRAYCALQIASRSMVLIIDLLALEASSVLDTVLTSLLKPDVPIKAGCGIGDDIALLARYNPRLKAFQNCSGLLDLRDVFVQHVSATGLPVQFHTLIVHGNLLVVGTFINTIHAGPCPVAGMESLVLYPYC